MSYLRLFPALFLSLFLLSVSSTALAQGKKDTLYSGPGSLWGVGFGDFAYKADADPGKRGGTNQYTGIAEKQPMFQFRRIYLGYDHRISSRFTANFLLALEDNGISTANNPPAISGDLLANGKLGLFVKNASVTWNNFLPGADLSLGQVFTPATVLTTELLWDYRCIERTISELRRTPAWDMGLSLNGKLHDGEGSETGYHLMVGNGSGSRPQNDRFLWYYGDVYTKLFGKRLVLDLYADYTRIQWDDALKRDRFMVKGMVAWTTPRFTAGIEAFQTVLRKDNEAATVLNTELIDTRAVNWSAFARAKVYRDLLGMFVRYDRFDPAGNIDNERYSAYTPSTPNYNPNTREDFFTAGLDFTPNSNIHIMPNVWMMRYSNAGPSTQVADGTDLVYRLSIYYVYGK